MPESSGFKELNTGLRRYDGLAKNILNRWWNFCIAIHKLAVSSPIACTPTEQVHYRIQLY